jgi:hypothetical protein
VSITPAECKATRKLLGWFARGAGDHAAHRPRGFERRERRSPSLNRRKLRAVFEVAGVEFAEDAEPKLTPAPSAASNKRYREWPWPRSG